MRDLGEYGDQSIVGKNGLFFAPKWSYGKNSGRSCLAPDPPEKAELSLKIPSAFGGGNPARHMPPNWSIYGKDRSQLPYDTATWTPTPASQQKPGPGEHDTARAPRWKAVNRKGTFGGRTLNLHPDQTAWVPRTHGSRLGGGEWSRWPKPAPKSRSTPSLSREVPSG